MSDPTRGNSYNRHRANATRRLAPMTPGVNPNLGRPLITDPGFVERAPVVNDPGFVKLPQVHPGDVIRTEVSAFGPPTTPADVTRVTPRRRQIRKY